jgi:Flp pilus assembly protein TadD
MPRRRFASLSHPVFASTGTDQPRDVTLARRARKHRLRGERRQALLALEEACLLTEHDARLWALYAASCWRMRRYDDAARALRQAIFLRAREGDDRRVAVLEELLTGVEAGGAPRVAIAA